MRQLVLLTSQKMNEDNEHSDCRTDEDIEFPSGTLVTSCIPDQVMLIIYFKEASKYSIVTKDGFLPVIDFSKDSVYVTSTDNIRLPFKVSSGTFFSVNLSDFLTHFCDRFAS